MAVVKDNAYGHGLVAVAKRLSREGCRLLAVATLQEALLLEAEGIPAGDILILRSLTATELPVGVRSGFALTIGDGDQLLEADRLAAAVSTRARVHLKADTGLGRLGFLPDQAEDMAGVVACLKATHVVGIYSHFAVTATRHEHNDKQMAAFLEVVRVLDRVVPGITRHIAATAATIGMPESRLDMVRPGGLLLGLTGVGENPWGVEPAMSFRAPLVQVKTVPPGWNVGYRLTYTAPDRQRIGTVAAGAGDSYPYALKLKADVLVRGRRCRVLGMALDQLMIDLSGVPGASTGDEAVLIGTSGSTSEGASGDASGDASGGASIGAEELGRIAGTSYGEILSRIPARIPRLYIEHGRVSLIESQTDMRDLLTMEAPCGGAEWR
jgi:alanine racemase